MEQLEDCTNRNSPPQIIKLILDDGRLTVDKPLTISETLETKIDHLIELLERPEQPEKVSLSIEEAAKYLGVGRDKMQNLIDIGAVYAVNLGSGKCAMWRIGRKSLDDYLNGN